MADIIEEKESHVIKNMSEIPSNSKANAGLTLGIIGTALSVLGTGVAGMLTGRRNCGGWDNYGNCGGYNRGNFGNFGGFGTWRNPEEEYIERKECQDYLNLTKEAYENKLDGRERLTNAFFDAYKRDVDNSFNLYKNQRDIKDSILAHVGASDAHLNERINEIDKKVDMMAAVRPYQDALINSKIDNNALIAAYELQKRTCRMIQGELVLPSSPVVTGYPSYTFGGRFANTATAEK